jgi:type IV secretion system protein VirB10
MADDENIPPPPPNPAVPPVEPEPVLESPETTDDFVVEEETPQDLEMNRSGPAVGKGPTKALVTGFVMFVVMGLVLWSLFSGSSEEAPPVRTVSAVAPPSELNVTPTPPPPSPAPTTGNLSAAPSVPPVPPPPPPPAVPPLPPPPPKFNVTTPLPPPPKPATAQTAGSTAAPPPPAPGEPPPSPSIEAISPVALSATGNDQARQERLRSNMLILDSEKEGKDNIVNGEYVAEDDNAVFQSGVTKSSKAERELSVRLSNLNSTIAQGKIINAVLETAINTDLPGPLRAIVSRDIYTESGRNIAIPKGSRLIGVYNSSILRGQSRVLIVWTRVIRPDGVYIMVGSPGIDALGRAGIMGIADNKYSEIFSAALLTSVITIGVAAGTEAISGDQATTTTNSNGTTTTGSASALAAADAVGTIGNVGANIVNTMLDLKPTITVDQGTLINVFVNKDLTFPASASGTQFVD